jgi:FkbM family methyltransferase
LSWYDDTELTRLLPRRYRLYAKYSRAMGRAGSRSVRGGSFLLRALRIIDDVGHLGSIAPIRGTDDLVVIADLSDERILEVIHEIRGENPEYAMMKEVLSAGDTFIDVGANFGTFSLLASRIVGASGRVIAVEPQKKLAKMISESIEASRAPNCTVMPVACGRHRGIMQLLVPHHDSGRAGFLGGFSGRSRHHRTDVEIIPLDNILGSVGEAGRLLVKIDVEGSEFDVLEGARELIARKHPTLMIELNPWSLRAAGKQPADLLELLAAMGYQSFATSESFPATVPVGAIDLRRQTNILARQAE